MIKKISIFAEDRPKRIVQNIHMLETVLLKEYNNKDVVVHVVHLTDESTGTIIVYHLSVVNKRIYYTFVKNPKERIFNIKEILLGK